MFIPKGYPFLCPIIEKHTLRFQVRDVIHYSFIIHGSTFQCIFLLFEEALYLTANENYTLQQNQTHFKRNWGHFFEPFCSIFIPLFKIFAMIFYQIFYYFDPFLHFFLEGGGQGRKSKLDPCSQISSIWAAHPCVSYISSSCPPPCPSLS